LWKPEQVAACDTEQKAQHAWCRSCVFARQRVTTHCGSNMPAACLIKMGTVGSPPPPPPYRLSSVPASEEISCW
jgi:hypothetical protein